MKQLTDDQLGEIVYRMLGPMRPADGFEDEVAGWYDIPDDAPDREEQIDQLLWEDISWSVVQKHNLRFLETGEFLDAKMMIAVGRAVRDAVVGGGQGT